jgi:hypothetical protein
VALNFPNLSRSYDAAGNRIRFWGHDGALEIPFFLDVGAILQFFPETPNVESGILAVFDAGRDHIIKAAGKVYSASRRRRPFYVVAAADFP